MKMLYCKMCMVSILMAGMIVSAQDWNRWRGPNQNGITNSKGTFQYKDGFGLEVEWKTKLGVAYSSVSVVGNQAVTMISDGKTDFVVSFDVITKKETWKYIIGPAYKSIGPDHDGPNSTPFIENGVVYGLGANGNLFAIQLKDGKEIWKKNLTKDFSSTAPEYGFTTSPIIADGVLIVQTGQNGKIVSGLNPKTGEELWGGGDGVVKFQSPIYVELSGHKQVVGASDKKVFSFDAKTGKIFWEYPLKGDHQSNTPLLVGKDRIFIRTSNRESSLLKIKSENGKFTVENVWTVSQGSGSLSEPIYYDGAIYSYTRRFLACLDVETGELKWKSRPPGEGWLMMVDDQLVVLTRTGVLHIIKATTDAYKPLTSLKILDQIVWTPPTFANGRLFARSLEEIVTVKMEKGIKTVAVEQVQDEPVMKLPKTKFGQFVATLEKSTNKKEQIASFMKGKKSPIFEGQEYAHIIYNGPAEDLVLLGDMLEWGVEAQMNRVEGTNFFYASFKLAPDARLNYFLVRDFDNRITDPLNPVKVQSIVGECSQLAMPKWSFPEHLNDSAGQAKGTIEQIEIKGSIFKETRKADVYLPFNYKNSSDRYPVVYINYGIRAVQMGKVNQSLDNLIGKSVKPVIAVFIQAPNSGREFARNDRDKYAEMIKKELIPYIDSHYRTLSKPDNRAFMGGDEGGYAAIYAAFKYPNTFGKVAGQSTHLMPTAGGNELFELVKSAPKTSLKIYLDWGAYDYRNKAQNFNWIEYNKDFAKLLKDQGYSVHMSEVNEGWGWASWRNRTDKILAFFFPNQ